MSNWLRDPDEGMWRAKAEVAGAPTGERNNTLNRWAFMLGRLVASGALGADEVHNVLEKAALIAELPEDEARRTIRSGMNAGIKAHESREPAQHTLAPPYNPPALPGPVEALPLTRWTPRTIYITQWSDKRNPQAGKQETRTPEELFDCIAFPLELSANDDSAKDTLPLWNAGVFENGYRSNESAILLDAVVLDIDDGTVIWEEIETVVGGGSHLAHSTISFLPEAQRWRVILLTSRSMTPEEYRIVWRFVAARVPGVDMATGDPARGFFVPVEPDGREYRYIDGTCNLVLDVDAILASTEGSAPAEATKSAAKAPVRIGRLRDLVGGDWLLQEPAPRPMLLRIEHALPGHAGEIFPLGKTAMIAGAGGTGKTMLVVSLAISTATGRPWLGLFEVAHPGDVLLVVGEEDLDEMVRRLQRIAQAMDLTEEERHLVYRRIHVVTAYGADVRFPEDGSPTGMMARLLGYLSQAGSTFSLIVLDPAARFMGGSAEVDAGAATRFIEKLEQLTSAPGGPCVLVTHHVSKSAMRTYDGDQGAPRGSSALVDGVRTLLLVDRVNLHKKGLSAPPRIDLALQDSLRLTISKANYCVPSSAPFWVRISKHGILNSLGERASQYVSEALSSLQQVDDGEFDGLT